MNDVFKCVDIPAVCNLNNMFVLNYDKIMMMMMMAMRILPVGPVNKLYFYIKKTHKKNKHISKKKKIPFGRKSCPLTTRLTRHD